MRPALRSTARASSRRGVAAVELAILLPLLALLFVITIDFARVFYYQLTLENCARNGAVFGSNLRSYQEMGCVNYNNIIDATLADGSSLNPPLDSSQITVTSGTGSDGNPDVTVTISYPFTTITQFPGFGNALTLKASTSMRVAP
jgi:Flp pilus assembly protein TadG